MCILLGVSMPQVNSISVENIPSNTYYVDREKKKEEIYKNEDHIHKQGPLSGLKAELYETENTLLTYFPKGFMGSKNSNFHEFLSMGRVPYVIGSIMLIGLYSFANGKYNVQDKASANNAAKCFGAGVVMYAIGKWLTKKIAHLGIKMSTGVPLDLRYTRKIPTLPEPGQEKGIVEKEYAGVFESVDFFRKDLLKQDSELNHNGDMHYFNDKIVQKAGYGKDTNSSYQIADPKIRELKARTTALENITSYITAATGVALGSQEAFKQLKFVKHEGFVMNMKTALSSAKNAVINSFKELWKGNNKNFLTKHYGKALILSSIAATILTWLVPSKGFKSNPDTMKSKVNNKKEYEVC